MQERVTINNGTEDIDSATAQEVSVGTDLTYTVTVKFVGTADKTASDTLTFSLELTKAQA